MSSRFTARPVWAGLAIRLEDGRLYAVELDVDVTATIRMEVEEIETFEHSTWRTFRAGAITVEATIRGIGRPVVKFGDDMGADRQPKPVESERRAIESTERP